MPPHGKNKKQKNGQTKLSAFFTKPPLAQKTRKPTTVENTTRGILDNTESSQPDTSDVGAPSQLDYDHYLALQPSASQETDPLLYPTVQSTSQNTAAWSQLLAPIQPPRCTVHGEPAKEFTVNKPGPNKGKNFFVCSRCVWRLFARSSFLM